MFPLWYWQFLEEEGLTAYVDSALLRREIQESMDMTEEDLERAALQLMQAGNGSPPPTQGGGTQGTQQQQRHEYYEHLGGFGMHEMQDFNKYSGGGGGGGSNSGSAGIPSAPNATATTQHQAGGDVEHHHHQPRYLEFRDSEDYSLQDGEEDEDMTYVTTL